jgi:hypothetical protein
MQSKQLYNVAIAFDEFASGKCAFQACHRLISEFKDDVALQVKFWSFADLRNSAVNLTAARDAARAQMVMVAASSEEPPWAVKKWIEWSLAWNGEEHGMLVALLNIGRASENCSSTEAYLRLVAASRGMKFLLQKTIKPGGCGALSHDKSDHN